MLCHPQTFVALSVVVKGQLRARSSREAIHVEPQVVQRLLDLVLARTVANEEARPPELAVVCERIERVFLEPRRRWVPDWRRVKVVERLAVLVDVSLLRQPLKARAYLEWPFSP